MELIPIEDCTANGIIQITLKVLDKNAIPIQNLIVMTTDNCAVMMGKTKLWNQNLNRLFQIYLQIDI